MNRVLITGLFLCLAPLCLQSAETSIPRMPSLARASIILTFDSAAQKANAPASIEVIRFDKIQLNRITWPDKSTSVSYFVDHFLISNSPVGDWVNIFDLETDTIDSLYRLTRPNAFSWIGQSTFVRADKFGERLANLFQRKSSDDGSMESFWCDPSTGLPLAWSDGVSICTFAFGTPPTIAPELIPKFKREFDRYLQIAAIPKQISDRP